MREIKLRAWDKKRKLMLNVGDLWELWQDGAEAEHEGTSIFDSKALFDRDDITFLEYTGLHDKNGVEIYELDIYKSGLEVHIVERGVWGDDQYLGWNVPIVGAEVIGNIYENSELIK